jgi:hypothetical protein
MYIKMIHYTTGNAVAYAKLDNFLEKRHKLAQGTKFGPSGNSIYCPDDWPAHQLRRCERGGAGVRLSRAPKAAETRIQKVRNADT